MLFNSIEFLLYLPTVFLLYWFLFNSLRLQNLLVVVASYLFYGWWSWEFLLLIGFTSLCSFISGVAIERYNDKGKWIAYYMKGKKMVECSPLGLNYGHNAILKEKNKVRWYEEMKRVLLRHTIKNNEHADKVFQESVQYLEKVAKMCNERNIKLHFIIPPVHPQYYAGIKQEQLATLYSTINEVVNSYKNVSFSGYFTDVRFNDDDFYDGNHLTSDIGAQKFSMILKEDISWE